MPLVRLESRDLHMLYKLPSLEDVVDTEHRLSSHLDPSVLKIRTPSIPSISICFHRRAPNDVQLCTKTVNHLSSVRSECKHSSLTELHKIFSDVLVL